MRSFYVLVYLAILGILIGFGVGFSNSEPRRMSPWDNSVRMIYGSTSNQKHYLIYQFEHRGAIYNIYPHPSISGVNKEFAYANSTWLGFRKAIVDTLNTKTMSERHMINSIVSHFDKKYNFKIQIEKQK